jgi:putative heme-binding domain-containing protein
VRTNVLGLLSTLSLKAPPWKGDWWNTTPANGKPTPKTSDWDGTAIVSAALRDAVQDPQPLVRAIGLEWLHTSHDTNAASELARMFKRETNVAVRASIVLALPTTPTPTSREILNSIFKDPNAPPALVQAAIEIAGKSPGVEWDWDMIRIAQRTHDNGLLGAILDVVGRKKLAAAVPIATAGLSNSNSNVREHAVDALKQIGGQPAIDALAGLLNNPDLVARRQAIAALGAMKAKTAVPRLLPCLDQPELHDDAVTALAQIGDLAAFDAYMQGLESKNSSLRIQCENALRGLRTQAFPLIEARLATRDFPATALASLKQIYMGDATAKKSSIFRHKVLEVKPGEFADFAQSHPGDSRRGKKLFHDLQGVGCIRCHHIAGEGGDIGPDLTDIRAKHTRADIIESVVYPSKQILDGYQQVFFQIKDDEEVSGIVRSETPDDVTVIDSGGIKHVLEKTNIVSRKISKISLMPEGLQDGLSLVEFSDLIAYVENPNVPTAIPPGARARAKAALEPVLTASQNAPPPPEVTGEELFSPFASGALSAPPRTSPPASSSPPVTASSPTPDPSPPSAGPPTVSVGPPAALPVSAPSSNSFSERVLVPPSGPSLPPAPPAPQSPP